VRRIRGVGASLALALGTQAAAGPIRAIDLEPGVTVESEWAVGTRDGRSQKLELELEPELRADLGHDLRLTAIGRIRADAFDRLEPGHPDPVEVSSLSRRGFWGDHVDYALRELTLEARVGRAFLTIGKQQIVWGQADGLKVLDVVDPQDFREFILDDFEDSRIPLWSVDVEIPVGPVVAELVWVPDPSFHEIPEPGAVYAFTAPRFLPPPREGFATAVRDLERPRRIGADGDAGLRLTSYVGGVDLSLVYLYRYDDRPVFRGEPGVSALGPTYFFTPQYERTHLVGGTFSSAFGDLTVRGEVALQTDRYLSTTDPDEVDALLREPELGTVLGFDWYGLRDTLLSLQIFQSWILGRAPGILRDRLDTTLTFLARRSFRHDRLRLEAIWLHDLNDGDGLLRPRIVLELRDGLETWLGADLFYGTADGVFGEFDTADRVVLGMRWGF
jgi:hypothetical protein